MKVSIVPRRLILAVLVFGMIVSQHDAFSTICRSLQADPILGFGDISHHRNGPIAKKAIELNAMKKGSSSSSSSRRHASTSTSRTKRSDASSKSSKGRSGSPSSSKGRPSPSIKKAGQSATPTFPPSTPPPVARNYATKTILGQNVINCRSFSIDSQKKFEFLGSFNSLDQVPIFPLPEVAFVGRSNVGKSSLLNCITGLNKNIAVQSKTPGRTQSINLFKCSDREGDICILVDLPGYGFAKMSKDKQEEVSQFLLSYLKSRGALRSVVMLVDARRDAQQLDIDMTELLMDIGIPTSITATKVDKLKPNECEKSLSSLRKTFELSEDEPIPFSSFTGQGKRDLWRAIKRGILGDADADDEEGDYDDDEEEGVWDEDEVEDSSENMILSEFY